LQRDHGIVTATGERASLAVADHLDETAPFDLVIVTTLAHQAGSVLPALQRSQARHVHFMFVTPEADRLRAAVGAHRATFGMAAVLSMLDSDGKLSLTIPKTKSMQGDRRWVDLFQSAGLPSTLEQNMGRWLRSQAPLTVAMEGVTGAGMQHKRGATWAEAKTAAHALRAGYTILRDLGEIPYPRSKDQLSRAPQSLPTVILWGISRSRFRETVGNSSEERQGLICLLAAEGGQKPELRDAVDALLTLHPRRMIEKSPSVRAA
jgi:2-dehydropantoate 2-reductase